MAAAQARRRGAPCPSTSPTGRRPTGWQKRSCGSTTREFGGFGADGKFLNAVGARLRRRALRGHPRRPARRARHAHARRDGLGRHLRPGGRRVLPLRGGPRLGAASHREDARGPGRDDRPAARPRRSCSIARTGETRARRHALRPAHARRPDPRRVSREPARRRGVLRRQRLDPRDARAAAVDRTLFTDLDAQGAAAWLRASVILDDIDLGRFGLQSLERVLLATYRPGEGVAHYHGASGEVRGLLRDQVHAAWALLHVYDATANETYTCWPRSSRAPPCGRTGIPRGRLPRLRTGRSWRHRAPERPVKTPRPQLPGRPRALARWPR